MIITKEQVSEIIKELKNKITTKQDKMRKTSHKQIHQNVQRHNSTLEDWKTIIFMWQF